MHRSFRTLAVAAALSLAATAAVAGDSIHSDDFDAEPRQSVGCPIPHSHGGDDFGDEGFGGEGFGEGANGRIVELGRQDPLVTYSSDQATITADTISASRATCASMKAISPYSARTAVACGRATGVVSERF